MKKTNKQKKPSTFVGFHMETAEARAALKAASKKRGVSLTNLMRKIANRFIREEMRKAVNHVAQP